MKVEYKNVSDKEIVGLEFSAAFIDAVGDRHKADEYFTAKGSAWGKSVKPGTKSSGVWSIALYSNYFDNPNKDIEVKIHKVLFKDGTKWAAQNDEE